MSRTKKTILVVIAAILFVVAIFFLLRVPRRGQPPTPHNQPLTTNQQHPAGAAPASIPPPRPLTPEEQAVEDDKAAARTAGIRFAERFGSYSNQGLFLNITDLYPLMTVPMRAWADDFKREASSREIAGYAGVTTRALTAVVDEYLGAEGKMRVVVGTQREESTNAGSKVYTQDLTVHLVKDAGAWKVHSIEWGEAR